MKPPLRKRIGWGLLLAGASTLAALAVCEVLVRVFWPQVGMMEWLTPDTHYGHVMKPDYHYRYGFADSDFVMDVRTNSLGLRDKELEPRVEGRPTILFLGDSFVFGHAVAVEDRFDTKLAELFARSGKDFRLINAGVSAWGTLQETAYAKDRFGLFQPDVVVLVFCGNDPQDDLLFQNKRVSFDEYYFPGKAFLRSHSHLFRLVTRRAFLLWYNYRVKRKMASPGDAQVRLDAQTASLISEADWIRTLDAIRDFHRAFRDYSPRGVLMLMASDPTNTDIREHLASLANGSDIVYLDLSEAAASLRPAKMRLPFDGHWSPLMHAAVAQALYDAIGKPKS